MEIRKAKQLFEVLLLNNRRKGKATEGKRGEDGKTREFFPKEPSEGPLTP